MIFLAKEMAIIIHSDPHIWEVRKLSRMGQLLIDKMTGKAYPVNGRKITVFKGKRPYTYLLIDGEKGVSLELDKISRKKKELIDLSFLKEFIKKRKGIDIGGIEIERDETTVLKLKTNPELVYQAIEGGLLLKLFRIKPTMGQVIAGIILGLIIGVIIGGILF